MGEKEWETEEERLSPSSPIQRLIDLPVYRSSEDKKGHEVFLGAKFPKGVGRWVEELRENPNTPYKINADVVRDALYIGLQVLNLRYKLDPSWIIEEALARIRYGLAREDYFADKDTEVLNSALKYYREGKAEKAKELIGEYLRIMGEGKRADEFRQRIAVTELHRLLEE